MLKCTIRKSATMRGMASLQLKLLRDRSNRNSFHAVPAGGDTVSDDYFPDGGDHIVCILVGHFGVKRKREQPFVYLLGNRELIRAVTVPLAIKRVPVQGDEMD